MTTIQKDEHVFSVDIEKTKEYYKTHSLCDCVYCCNYYAQVKERFPKLDVFLSEFGVDISKPDEIFSVEMDDYIDYINVDYTVCGKTETVGKYEFDIQDNLSLSITITDGSVSPNEQTEEHFTISVMQIQLPWVLDEPFPKPLTKGFLQFESNLFDSMWKRVFFHNFKKSRNKYGLPIACGIILIICLIRGISNVVLWQESFWNGFLYPFFLFLAGSLIMLPIYILSKKAPKVASIICTILLLLGIAFLALCVLFILYGLVKAIFS